MNFNHTKCYNDKKLIESNVKCKKTQNFAMIKNWLNEMWNANNTKNNQKNEIQIKMWKRKMNIINDSMNIKWK